MVLRLPLAIIMVFVAVACGVLYITTFLSGHGDSTCHDCNVLLIMVDTLRADHVSCYGYFEETTPSIDATALLPRGFRSAPQSFSKASS